MTNQQIDNELGGYESLDAVGTDGCKATQTVIVPANKSTQSSYNDILGAAWLEGRYSVRGENPDEPTLGAKSPVVQAEVGGGQTKEAHCSSNGQPAQAAPANESLASGGGGKVTNTSGNGQACAPAPASPLPAIEEVAVAISGAPFPSTKSLRKAQAIDSLYREHFAGWLEGLAIPYTLIKGEPYAKQRGKVLRMAAKAVRESGGV